MPKFQLPATKWSKLVCSAVLVSGLSNTASAQQSSFEGLPSFPGLTQTGTTPAGATQTSAQQSSPAPQFAMPQSQTAISEQQLINSMPNSMAPAGQLSSLSQSTATVQSAVGAVGTTRDESLANATAAMEDAHASQMESTLTELEAAHAHAYNTLAAVLEKVPADARPAIQQAMEQSRQGYQKARDNRERVVAHKMNSQNARRGRNPGNGPNTQHMQAGQQGQHGQHSQPRSNGQPGYDGRQNQFAGQQPNAQQGQGVPRPNAMQGRTVSGPSQPNFGTAQFSSAQDATSGTPQGSALGLIEGTPSITTQANPSAAQPGNRNYSTPEMNRTAPGRPMINGVNGANGVNGTVQGNNFGVPANQRNANFGTNQPGAVQGSNGQSSNSQGMSRPSAAELNRYNQTKPSTGYSSQPANATSGGSTPTGSASGSGFNGFGSRK